jgi:putative phosphoesterase
MSPSKKPGGTWNITRDLPFKTLSPLSPMNVRIVVLSDIHANFGALKTLKGILAEADVVLCLGDFVGYYTDVNEVLDFCRALNAISIRGNHDEYLLSGCPQSAPEAVHFGIEFADRVIYDEHRRWLATLPLVWGGPVGERTLLLSHGSPFRPLMDYLYSDKVAGASLEKFDFDLLAFGQTHRPFSVTAQRPLLLNPGSVGQSRQSPGVACAARLNTEDMGIELVQFHYDPHAVIARAKEKGAGDWITKHLL